MQHGTPSTTLFELLTRPARTGLISTDLAALVRECPSRWDVEIALFQKVSMHPHYTGGGADTQLLALLI